MGLTETQIQGHKKHNIEIHIEDVERVLTRLGLRRTTDGEFELRRYQMAITKEWLVTVHAHEKTTPMEHGIFTLHFFVERKADGAKLGPDFMVTDANQLQLQGAKIMSEMFESVDDLTPFICGECNEGLLSWDGKKGTRVTKPGMKCSKCDWRGHSGAFRPLREYK